ncbi:hypothetical protein [Haloarchaeobius sp. DFWS5]|uniref:hypothetical protein n=1 Tax=Haloarchaeobius sp. DFWS5 TaxID=3446114 RepID=UPI003EBA49A8
MPDFEFGSLDDAREFRDAHDDYLCPHDDARKLTVTLVGDAPDRVLDQAAVVSAVSREDYRSVGQLSLTEAEKDRIDFSQSRANVPHAQAVKAIAADAGVDDWTAYYDGTLTTDEHRGVMQRAARDETGDRLDAEKSNDERLAELEQALDGQCEHAAGHCENGEAEACEFLQDECGFTREQVGLFLDDTADDSGEQSELVTVGGGEYPEMEVSPQEAGALHRSWQGYKSGIGRLSRELDDVREAVTNARGAIAAINAIRERHGQDRLHPDRLHDLLDALDGLPADIPEVRTLEHFAADVDGEVIEHDEQRDLEGGRASDQTRFPGQDRSDVEPETEKQIDENPGGIMADERPDDGPDPESTEQQIPDEFQVAEGGQTTI